MADSNREILREFLTQLKAVEEGSFRYFDLAKKYDITLNFIKTGSHLPGHTHEQTVFNYVMDGEFEVTDSEGVKTYRKGEWLRIAKGSDHSVVAKVETTLLEFWEK